MWNTYFYCTSVSALNLVTDTLLHRDIKEVTVKGIYQIRASLPVQVFSEKEIELANASSVSDIVKHFSGVTVKDYGGIGGMKTVSLRGLGAQHTGVSYDGVMQNDIQTGQIDLGRFSLDNLSEISVNNSQPNNIFQTARMFAYSGVIELTTKKPDFKSIKSFDAKITGKTGSFGLANAILFLNKNINKKWNINLFSDWLKATGAYPFVQHYGNQNNLSEILTRINADVQSIRSEINTTCLIHADEYISFKANYINSERGLPDVTYYNTFNKQRLLEDILFSQIHYLNKPTEKFQYQLVAKYNQTNSVYKDADSKYPEGFLTDNYLQKEYYVSYSAAFQPFEQLSTSVAFDWWLNDLNINSNLNFKNFVFPIRNTGLINIAAKYATERFSLGANVLGTMTREQVRVGTPSPDRNKLSPNVNVSYKLFSKYDLTIRAFYKNIFRVPTFNDLYYQDLGNINLRPENTNQYNLGMLYRLNRSGFMNGLEFSMDGYLNEVTDKIIAIPRDLFHWSMINKGKVEIRGVDLSLKFGATIRDSNAIVVRMNYTYQKATDKTPETDNYGEQIPYTPFSSGSGSISYKTECWEIGYNMLFSGMRWSGQNIQANQLNGYMEHSVFASTGYKCFFIKGEIINLLNEQYEIIKCYPMPGRNFRITISVNI